MILGREKRCKTEIDKRGDKDKRRKKENWGFWKEARGRGMMGGTLLSHPQKRK